MAVDTDVLIASTYIFCTIVIADVLRSLFAELINSKESIASKCVQEFISTVEVCAVCYECGFVMDAHGPLIYSFYSLITGAWLMLNWGDRASVDPFQLIIDFFAGAQELLSVVLVIGTQIIGCLIFYNIYLKHLWALGYGKEHMKKFKSLEQGCSSEVKGTVFEASLAESVAAFVILLSAKGIQRKGFSEVTSAFLNSFIQVCCEMSIMPISGGFLSPILATGFEFACIDNVMDHLIMFWIGPFIATVIAYFIWTKTGFSNFFGDGE